MTIPRVVPRFATFRIEFDDSTKDVVSQPKPLCFEEAIPRHEQGKVVIEVFIQDSRNQLHGLAKITLLGELTGGF